MTVRCQFHALSPCISLVWFPVNKDILLYVHNTTIKIRTLTLWHYYRLNLRPRSDFTSCPVTSFTKGDLNERIQFRISVVFSCCLFILTLENSPIVKALTLEICRPVTLQNVPNLGFSYYSSWLNAQLWQEYHKSDAVYIFFSFFMSTIVFLLPPHFEAVHDQQSLLGTFFTITESICLRNRHVFLQIGKKSFLSPLCPLWGPKLVP